MSRLSLRGLVYCPLPVRRIALPSRTRVRDQLYGSSPPSVFVGRVGYPDVMLYPAAPPETGDTSVYESPREWLGMPLERFLALRLSLYRGSARVRVEDALNPPRALQDVQLLSLSREPVDVELKFAREPRGVYLDERAPPMGPAAPLLSLRLCGEPKLDRAVERAYGDRDLKARDAVVLLYRSGLGVELISRALSVGALGARRRRLVPTRWAITAVDKIVSDYLVDRVKQFGVIDGYYLYARRAPGNLFVALLAPSRWAYEWGEAFEPFTVWNPGPRLAIETDYELYGGRGDYPEIGGCYYAARLAVAEALHAARRQAAAVVWREVYTGFTVPTGVWWVRENVRAMFRERPARYDTLEGALGAAGRVLKVPLDRWLSESRLIHVLKSRLL
jgi:hypothetical protein